MRTDRSFVIPKESDAYLHICNHAVNFPDGQLPFNDEDKKSFFDIINCFKEKYNIQIISATILGTHYHMLLHVSKEPFTKEEAIKAYNAYNDKKRKKKRPITDENDPRIDSVIRHSNNPSEFIREIQRYFSYIYNRSSNRQREGALWRNRFNAQVIENDAYFWMCLLYVELNPVRAGICTRAADYPYSTFGRWGAEHEFEEDFSRHVINMLTDHMSMEEMKEYMARKMEIMQAQDLAKKYESQGKVNIASQILEKVRLENNKLDDIQLNIFADKWYKQCFLGSDQYVAENKEAWRESRRPKPG